MEIKIVYRGILNLISERIVMKKRLFIFALLAILLVVVGFIMKDVLLHPIFYPNNNEFGKEANREIKSLLLNSMKDRHSTLFFLDKSKLYTEDLTQEDTTQARFWFIDIKDDFMQSLEKKENQYLVQINLKFPDDWSYYFTIEVQNGNFIISNIEIDP